MTEETPRELTREAILKAEQTEWKVKRGVFSGKITRTAKKVAESLEAPLESVNPATLVIHQNVLTQSLATYLEMHNHIHKTYKVEQAQEDVNKLEKLEDQVDDLTAKLQLLQVSVNVLPRLQAIQDELELLDPNEVDQHSAPQINALRASYQAIKALGGTALRHDTCLAGIATEVQRQLQAVTRALAQATPIPVLAAAPYDPITRDHTHRSTGFGRKRDLLKVDLPPFKGDIRDWPRFWKAFSKHIDGEPSLDEEDKLHYLRKYVQSPDDRIIIEGNSDEPGQYAMFIAMLHDKYDKPRVIHRCHVKDFMEIPPMRNDSGPEISRMQGAIANIVISLRNTGQFTAEAMSTSYSELLLHAKVREDWTKDSEAERKVPDINTLVKFLGRLAYRKGSLDPEMVKINRPREKPEKNTERPRYEKPKPRYERKVETPVKHERSVYKTVGISTCELCKKDPHTLFSCPEFLDYTVAKRIEYVKRTKLCFNCLSRSHDTRSCMSVYKCRVCQKSHHTCLHKAQPPSSEPAEGNEAYVGVVAATPVKANPALSLSPTLDLQAHSPQGKCTNVTALYDTGADISLVTNQVVNRLGLKRIKSDVKIIQALGIVGPEAHTMVKMTMTSEHVPGPELDLMAVVVPSLGGTNSEIQGDWPFLRELTLANPDFRSRKRLDVILGQDVLKEIRLEGLRNGRKQDPCATNTIWGWMVQGKIRKGEEPGPQEQHISATSNRSTTQQILQAQLETNKLLRDFFENEEMPQEKTQTMEELDALQHYEDTHQLLTDGRFRVSLPRKQCYEPLGASRPQAVKRYVANERALVRKKGMKPFQDVMAEYLSLNHAERVPQADMTKAVEVTYYLPMHAVIKASSTTTKLRVVFDASAKTTSGVSLNDTLLIGPTVYPLLVDILMRFRQHNVAITSDITKMFRAIELAPEDRDLHRFVWRKDPNDTLQDYRMTRVTFGVASSPFLATQTLQQISSNVTDSFPLASRALKQSFYVDDCITGAATVEEALLIARELQQALDRHGFLLRKWRSSSPAVMAGIPTKLHEMEAEQQPYGPPSYIKTLGIHWDAQQDNFHVSISHLELPVDLTKRALSSDIAKTFDVLGWFAPATIVMKILLQDLWRAKTDWDEPVATEVQHQWTGWREELPELAANPISRRYFVYMKKPTHRELHGFSDASEKAYSAVIYVRALYIDEPPTIELVNAKTKVAPLKTQSIPRLELCGALLLAQLVTIVGKNLDIPLEHTHCWCDSKIVLWWLDGRSRNHTTYVANRVGKTLTHVPPAHWKHVPGLENPADCGSRGITPKALMDHPLWWHGPEWLQHEPIHMPPQSLTCMEKDETHTREIKLVRMVTTTEPPWWIHQYSTYERLRRSVAWILRFTTNSRKKVVKRRLVPHLTSEDVIAAETLLCKQAQSRTFPKDQEQAWRTDKRTRALNPKKDVQGLIRVDGRLGNSKLAYNQRHPIILRGTDPLTRLIISHYHLISGHAGPQLLMSTLGRTYHILQGMAVTKSICRKCVTCTRFRNATQEQLMGQLPKSRVIPGYPFEGVGTDFAGPITTKRGATRRPTYDKTYICVFVCLTTRAVHLEAVSNLTTEMFMACLHRFIGRRGNPRTIYSDNGSNFVGAARELEEVYQFMRTKEVQNAVNHYCSSNHINWQFNPARAPHFGGIWEAAVKSLKNHLRKITNCHTLNFEELTTVLVKIEATLNSRPLEPLHSHSTEGVDVLTPGHFLVGRPVNAAPEMEPEVKLTLHQRFNLCKDLAQKFWTRWSDDVLKHLQQRPKWRKEMENLRVGDIVLIRGEQTYPTNSWPLARVVKVFYGKDGLVRVVEVRVGKKTFTRPIAKLTVLVPNMEDEDGEGNGLNPVSAGRDVRVCEQHS